jgi:hypothetical protein
LEETVKAGNDGQRLADGRKWPGLGDTEQWWATTAGVGQRRPGLGNVVQW